MPPRIALAVGAWTGDDPTQPVAEFTGGRLVFSLAKGPSCAFTMPGRSAAALVSSGLATDVWAHKLGALVFRGRMLPLAQHWGPEADTDVAVMAVGYKRLVEARHIVSGPPTFSADDQGDILWALVQHTQAQTGGDLGITEGSHTTGIVRDRNEYKVGDNLGKLMGDMGSVIDGAWWGVDAALEFSAALWDDFPTRTDPIVLGQNARSMDRTRSTLFANAVGAIGSTQHTTATWVATGTVGTDLRGRWEAFDASHSSVTEQATVDDYADGLLAERQLQPSVWKIELDPAWYFEKGSDYAEGEYVNIVVPTSAVDELGPPPVDVLAQVTEVSISFDEHGATSVVLACEEQ